MKETIDELFDNYDNLNWDIKSEIPLSTVIICPILPLKRNDVIFVKGLLN